MDFSTSGTAPVITSMKRGTELQKVVMVHPTVSELMPYVFENLEPLE